MITGLKDQYWPQKRLIILGRKMPKVSSFLTVYFVKISLAFLVWVTKIKSYFHRKIIFNKDVVVVLFYIYIIHKYRTIPLFLTCQSGSPAYGIEEIFPWNQTFKMFWFVYGGNPIGCSNRYFEIYMCPLSMLLRFVFD